MISAVIFDSAPPPEAAQRFGLIGNTSRGQVALKDALESADFTAYGHIGGKGILSYPGILDELPKLEEAIVTLAGQGSATLLVLEPAVPRFAIMRWEGGKLVRRHVASGGDYHHEGEELLVEAGILANFEPCLSEGRVAFAAGSGEVFSLAQIGDVLVEAVFEQELAELTVVSGRAVELFTRTAGGSEDASDASPTSASGGIQLLRTLVSKGQLELTPDASLKQLDAGMEPFLDTRRDSYEAAESLLDWLVDQPGVEEVYIATEHMAKLLARW